ncbi:peptidoglycan-binding domain-containing protein [Phytoactinopolyspora mesophila]|uniref:Peptidoglycan-binding protein n=1 Tax=Phytoactinopolyspora mesophila TaxID=2650750 RepID=A0A7K3M3Y2_9ACTN|nr:peptidoglycan-binding domain-containing protein [Phytoactinopolyspora mesophila]NDL58024.1 peptidoglycan-binding protein [Phytoactinopolyspora mesophila]
MRSRSRVLVIVVAVAVGALAAGVFAGTRITSPEEAAARTAPPTATAVTVPVERRTLESEVTTRGEASYTGAVDVAPELAGLETSPVVTGQVPDVGDQVKAGDVLLEIVGRPVIALPGDLPMYRSLRPGMSGPDVEQLEKALDALGFDPGTVDDTYTSATGRAVAELFDEAGYSPPAAAPDVQAELDTARQAMQMAEDEVADAEAALDAAKTGPSEAEKVAAQNDVDQATRALKQARRDGDTDLVAEAEAQLRLAQATLADLQKGPDTSAEQKMLDNARQRLSDAQAARDAAATEAGTPLPASEVVFVSSLPRRVDDVEVRRGGVVEGTVMSISGTDLVVTAEVDEAARELLEEDMEAMIELPSGEQITAPITRIREPSGDSSGHRVTMTPEDLTADQVDELRGANVRVTIPVESTEGDVLAVPLAALTAGPGGEARVEVQRLSAEGEEIIELLEVEVGLTARGYAEVEPVEGSLEEGDLVVIGGEADTGDGEGESDDER